MSAEGEAAALATRGIRSGAEMQAFLQALMRDLASGAVSPATGNRVCNAVGRMLRVVEADRGAGDGE